MWPLLLDMTKDESLQTLRNLELEAYSHLVSALRAQGPLSSDKQKLLKETSTALNISQERHRAEIRRALTDEKLTTIAFHVNAQNQYNNDWAQEGRRVIPLLPRMVPQTTLSALADEIAENADHNNKHLPLPANTERKRSMITPNNLNISGDCNKSNSNWLNETNKSEEIRKRKFSENSSLAQHLLGPANKMSKIQQIYRQKTKSKIKEQFPKVKIEQDQMEVIQNKFPQQVSSQKPQTVKITMNANAPAANGSKINILQNLNLQQSNYNISEHPVEQIQDVCNSNITKINELDHTAAPQSNMNENINNRLKSLTKSNNILLKSLNTPGAYANMDLQKHLKICSSRKSVAKTIPTTNQKLIVVSNSQSISNTSILQRTLSIPFVKNICLKNVDKFKIVSTSGTPVTLANSTVSSNSFNSVKHKVVTVRTSKSVNTGKKMLPLTQLQMLNKGSIKVLPFGGKIIGKSTTSAMPSSMYIGNSMQNKTLAAPHVVTSTKTAENENTQIVPSLLNLETSGLNYCRRLDNLEESTDNSFSMDKMNTIAEDDYDHKINEFYIQAMPSTAEDTVVEVKSEEIKLSNDCETNEVDKSPILCSSEFDCDVSDREVLETESLISPETMEQDMKESTNKNNREEFSGDIATSVGHKQDSEDIV